MYPVHTAFAADPGDIPRGQTADVNIVVETRAAAIAIARSAILTSDGQPAVAVVEGGQAAFRQIAFQDWPASSVVVTKGLNAGDIVILDPSTVRDGQAVHPKLTEAPE